MYILKLNKMEAAEKWALFAGTTCTMYGMCYHIMCAMYGKWYQGG